MLKGRIPAEYPAGILPFSRLSSNTSPPNERTLDPDTMNELGTRVDGHARVLAVNVLAPTCSPASSSVPRGWCTSPARSTRSGDSGLDDIDGTRRAWDGATQAWLAVSDGAAALTTGGYRHHQRLAHPAPDALDEEFQEHLLAELARHRDAAALTYACRPGESAPGEGAQVAMDVPGIDSGAQTPQDLNLEPPADSKRLRGGSSPVQRPTPALLTDPRVSDDSSAAVDPTHRPAGRQGANPRPLGPGFSLPWGSGSTG